VLRGGERAQRRLVELPDGVLGQLVEHLDEHRPLVLGQPLGAQRDDGIVLTQAF
jgi:hypothetical protein